MKEKKFAAKSKKVKKELFIEAEPEETKAPEETPAVDTSAEEEQMASFGSLDDFVSALTSDDPTEGFEKNIKPISSKDYAKISTGEAAPEEKAPEAVEEVSPEEVKETPKFFVMHMKGRAIIASMESMAPSPKDAFVESLEKFGITSTLNLGKDSFDVASEDVPYITRYVRGSRQIIVVNIDIGSFSAFETV